MPGEKVKARFQTHLNGLPSDYAQILAEIKHRIQSERLRVARAANSALVMLYWDIGRLILGRQKHEGWGTRVIDRLSTDLSATFPEMKGISPRNLKYMRAFASAWPNRSIVQEVLAHITWYHNLALLEKLKPSEERLWYARKSLGNGWSHNMLVIQIESGAYERSGKALHNFITTLPAEDSDLAGQVFKDPYVFDFLGMADLKREKQVEQALVDHIQKFLLELGAGFAFVGRQVKLEVGGQDFIIDLLFYHLVIRCYIVIELKAVPFEPAFVGQMNLYLSAVDDRMRHAEDKPTIGLLLCKAKNRLIVEYALRDLKRPIGVARWETKIVRALPKRFAGILPSIEQIEEELKR